ncbi:MAG: type II secretion system F family protein [Nanoarchaeota archaeon]
MKIKVPFSIMPVSLLRRISIVFYGLGSKISKNIPFLGLHLEQIDMDISSEEYLSMCIMSSLIFFVFINIPLNILLRLFDLQLSFILAFIISIPLAVFIFVQQVFYPRLKATKKIKNIERNLLPALQNLYVQLHAGIPLYRIMVNVANEDYGQISKEFGKAIKQINAGINQTDVLDAMATKNPSLYFRRAIWQLVNGMKTGSDTSRVVKEIIESLADEQLTQIQKYGGQLNPLAMFYMLIAIIVPTLGMTFLILLSSFLSTSELLTKLIFWSMYGFVFFFQIMFMGIIKTRRPTLLEK